MLSPTISGATRLIGLLGDPVAHSLSPLLHNHVFAALGLPYAYVPLAVKGRDIHNALVALRAFSFVGANVTIPHKQRVVPYCDALSPVSAAMGAVNTLYFRTGLLHGTTTDPEGFYKALAWMRHDPAGGRIVILGNGGIARTLAYALALDRIPRRLTLVGRDPKKVSALASELSAATHFPAQWTTFSDAGCRERIKECTLLVNCTSVGMSPRTNETPIDPAALHDAMAVFDTVYNPAETKLLADARRAGCAAQNGMRMLLYQGLASLKIWTGIEADDSIIDINELHDAGRGASTGKEE